MLKTGIMMKLINGDCLDELKKLEDNSIDACITDPPAGISFMNKSWDHDKGGRDEWMRWMTMVFTEVLRVLKPGGHSLVWSIPRTSHWTAMSLENAGFEIRDCVYHLQGQGFPKSHNIGKKIKEYDGYGSQLKPAVECWWLIRKPFKGSIVDNVLKYGTGALNIDKSRTENDGTSAGHRTCNIFEQEQISGGNGSPDYFQHKLGRFPANLIHDGSLEIQEARFFYCTKTSTGERNTGCKEMEDVIGDISNIAGKRLKCRTCGKWYITSDNCKCEKPDWIMPVTKNNHPTVKSVKLMSYLINLIMPPNGIVLDPFMGSGTTGIAALLNGYDFIGIEKQEEYMLIAEARINKYEEFRKYLK